MKDIVAILAVNHLDAIFKLSCLNQRDWHSTRHELERRHEIVIPLQKHLKPDPRRVSGICI